MARGDVPTLDLPEETPRPLPTPFDDTRVAPASFGAAIGEGLEQVGAAGAEIAAHVRHTADVVAVQRASAQARSAYNSLVLDPEQGYASTKGADAMARRGEFQDKFDKALNDATSTLASPTQQRMFAPSLMLIRRQAASRMAAHENQQQNQYAAAQFQGNFDQTATSLEHDIADPKAVDDHLREMLDIGVSYARARYGAGADKAAISSVVLPELQKAAYGGMQAAIATQDPQVARAALDKLGSYLITGHHRDFGKVVDAMQTRQQVGQSAAEIMGGAAESVVVPGGPPVARVDAVKVAAGLDALAKRDAGDPHLADIQKAVELQQDRMDKVWKATVAQVADRAFSAGQDPATGAFSLDNVAPADREWLNQHAPLELAKLRAQDQKAQRQDSAEARAAARDASRSNYSAAVSWLHDDANKGEVLGMTRQQFGQRLLDDSQYPDGLSPQDRTKALAEFDKVTKAGTKLDEAVPKTVTDAIRNAANGNPTLEKKLRDQLYGDLLDKANATYAGNKTIGTEALRKYVETELAKGSVTGAGAIFGDRNGVRQIEWEKSNEFGWKPFVTPNGETIPGHPVRMTKGGKTKLVQPDQVEAMKQQGADFAK